MSAPPDTAPPADPGPAATLRFAEVHALHRAELLSFLTRRLDAPDAEEVLQELLLRVARALPAFRGEGSVRTWVFRMARNAAVDRLRQRASRPGPGGEPAPAGDGVPEEASAHEAPGDGHDDRLIREEMRACIRERVEALPAPYREVLRLSEVDGLEDAEIAAAVGTSPGNVRVRLHRARARLRQELSCHCALYRDERNELACEPIAGGEAP